VRQEEPQDVLGKRHAQEIAGGERFAFGKNWKRFLETIDEDRIAEARISLQRMLSLEQLGGQSFLDIGSGSGLFSLAARQLGATVTSFDYDPDSVACAKELRRRFRDGDSGWNITQGSVLDAGFLEGLGTFDVVYSWGVLHHTGAMWQAIEKASGRVAPGGKLFISIYNDQGWISDYWRLVKRANSSIWLRPLIAGIHAPYLLGMRVLLRALT
jgi:2-polyprenyl-6-hydroxyphenyl methylase/3-demethylubiquinone-9 3-methyltransferase